MKLTDRQATWTVCLSVCAERFTCLFVCLSVSSASLAKPSCINEMDYLRFFPPPCARNFPGFKFRGTKRPKQNSVNLKHPMQIQKMKTKESAFIWAHLSLLKPSSSGAYCGQTFAQNHKIIIIMRLVKPTDFVDPYGAKNHLHKITFDLSLLGPSETL